MSVHRKRHFLLWLVCFFVAAFVFACDSDSSSSSEPSDEPGTSSGSKSKKSGDSEIDADYSLHTPNVILDTIYDTRHRLDMPTVQFGPYIWTGKNAWSDGNVSGLTWCYSGNHENCDAYGMLYHNDARNACPPNFNLPSREDWTMAMKYREQFPEVEAALTFPLGGYCNYKTYMLLGEEGVYLTSGGYTARVKSGSVTFEPLEDNDYASVRCVRYSYIVATEEDLPLCDSDHHVPLPFFVMKEKSNFRCMNDHWVDVFTNTCADAEPGTYSIYKDSTYICKDEEWQLANMRDVGGPDCTKENVGATYQLNGITYQCTSLGFWDKPNNQDKEFGLCTKEREGEIDTLFYTRYGLNSEDSVVFHEEYVCRSFKWEKVSFTDYFEKCDSTRLYEIGEYLDMKWVRDKPRLAGYGWRRFNLLEKKMGLCTLGHIGVLDTTDNGEVYCCDSSGWREPRLTDYLGMCTPEIPDDKIEVHEGVKYVCQANAWRELTYRDSVFGVCSSKSQGARDSAGNFICDDFRWRGIVVSDDAGECTADNLYEIFEFNQKKYHCADTGWAEMTKLELNFGLCREEIEDKVDSLDSFYYVCKKSKYWTWKFTTYAELMLGECVTEGEVEELDGVPYECDGLIWRKK